MAINKSVKIERIEVFPETSDDVNTNKGHPSIHVISTITFVGTGQNSSDVDLPLVQNSHKILYYYSDEDKLTKTSTAGEDKLVRLVAKGIWS
tara:strand:- start:1327 stop:1602 length:276 start_codon:yes stop_codon:yes gene_type:complete